MVYKGDGAMFHLTGGIGLGVDVADFLKFQRTLHGGRQVDAARQVQRVWLFKMLLGYLYDGVLAREDFFGLHGEVEQGLLEFTQLFGAGGAAYLGEVDGEQGDGD